jgi:hypothetical protein
MTASVFFQNLHLLADPVVEIPIATTACISYEIQTNSSGKSPLLSRSHTGQSWHC